MNYLILKGELDLPAYAAMSDQAAADDLNLVDITRIKSSMNGAELLDSQDATEFIALTDNKKAQWLYLCGLASVDPSGQAVEVVKDIWGTGSTTVSNLNTAREELISRATELGLGNIRPGDVEYARTL